MRAYDLSTHEKVGKQKQTAYDLSTHPKPRKPKIRTKAKEAPDGR